MTAASTALAPLHPDTAQSVFRAVLDALARPGTVHTLPAHGAVPGALLPVLALADLDTPVTVLSDEDWADRVGTATGAPVTTIGQAALVAALRPLGSGDVRWFPTGSAAAPESAALVSMAVPGLDGGPRRTLSGPGAPGTRTVQARGIPPELWTVRAAVAFPAGFDLVLVDPDGRVVGIPRSSRIEED